MSKLSGRWLYPRRDDPLNLILWWLAPWLAGIEWAVIIIAIFTPAYCGTPVYRGPPTFVDYLGFSVFLFVPMMLFLVSLRALASGAYPRYGSWILAATNGFLLLLALVNIIDVCLEYYF